MFEVPVGTVLSLSRGDWSLDATVPGTYHLFLRVQQVRYETAAQYHDREVWVDGVQLTRDGMPLERRSLLVKRGALLKTAHVGDAPELATQVAAPAGASPF